MTAFRTLFVLFAALALVGVAEAQKGGGKPGGGGGDTLSNLNCTTDQIARFNGTAWVCSTDRTSGGPSYRLIDSSGTELPIEFFTLGTDGDQALVNLDVNIGGQIEPLRLLVYSTSISIHDIYENRLYYRSTDCSGTPYLETNTYGMAWLSKRFISPIKEAVDAEKYTLYYSAIDPVSTRENIGSYLNSNFGQTQCSCASFFQDVGICDGTLEMDVTPVVGSMPFEITYTPPFTLVRD